MSSPTITYSSVGQARPTPIRLGSSYVLRRQVFVNDGTGRVLKGGLPGISEATLSIYYANTTPYVALTVVPMNVITIANGQELLFTLGTSAYPLTAANEFIGEIVATRNGVPSEVKQWFFDVVDLTNVFDSNSCC
jgi:hypothetical protein